MKKILLLGTGGTIASEPHNTGLSPELSPEQLLSFVPGISSPCRVESRSLFSVDSTNMTPTHWVRIAEAAFAKIMYILGKTKDPDEISRLFYEPVAHDILYRCGD